MPRKKIEKISKEVTEKSTKVVKKAEKHSYYFGVGRRKSAVARVKLHLDGDKSFKINKTVISESDEKIKDGQ